MTLFSGEGAIGKSIVELMLCVAHVTGRDSGSESLPEPGGAFYFGCEDDEAELRLRLTSILAHYGTTFEEAKANGFRFKSLAGEDAILGAPDRNGIIKPTKLFDQLDEQAGDLKPKHIGIDISADVFAGNENDRTQVRQFISLLRRLAIVANGAVNLLKDSAALLALIPGRALAARLRGTTASAPGCTLTALKMDAGEQPDTDLREIVFKNSNYGKVADGMVLTLSRRPIPTQGGVSGLRSWHVSREPKKRSCRS